MRIIGRMGVGLVALAIVPVALAQGAGAPAPPYDVKHEIVLKGRVADVRAIPDWMGKNGVNVTLQTQEAAPIHVDTAPASFLQMLDFSIADGDDLDVTGAYAMVDGRKAFLARQLHIKHVTVSIRDLQGKPLW